MRAVEIWIANPFDNLPPEGGRPQRYWLMARAFARAGHRVTLWTSDFSHARKAPRVLARGVSWDGDAARFRTLARSPYHTPGFPQSPGKSPKDSTFLPSSQISSPFRHSPHSRSMQFLPGS